MFMQFPIDVVFVDQDLVVLKISAAVRPFRTAACRGAREVVELKAGECERRGLAVGDRVAWASYQASRPAGDAAAPVDEQRPRTVVIASRDRRFVRLLRFLLESHGVERVRDVSQDSLLSALEHLAAPAAVVLDAEPGTADALAIANAARTRRPEIPVLLAAETERASRAPAGTVIHDKWNGTEALAEATAAALAGPSGATPPGALHVQP
jgi:CheY-like chemotaxis protein